MRKQIFGFGVSILLGFLVLSNGAHLGFAQEQEPKPQPSPSAVPNPQPAPEPAPSPSPTAVPNPQPAPEPAPSPSPTAVPNPQPAPEPAPVPSPTPTPDLKVAKPEPTDAEIQSYYHCSEEAWVGGAGEIKNQFVGTLTSTCYVSLPVPASLGKLDRYYLEQIKNSKTVHAGPEIVKYLNLECAKYDATVETKNGSERLEIRQDMLSGWDLGKHYLYATISKNVNGEGQAKPLRKLDVHQECIQGDDLKHINMQFTIGVTVDRPAPFFVPWSMIVPELKKAMNSIYKTRRDSAVKDSVRALLREETF